MRGRPGAALLLVVLVACGNGDGGTADAVRASAGQESTTTSTLAPTTTVAGATTTTAPAGARTTTTARAGATTTTTAVAGAKALTPAVPGTYRFDTAGATTVAGVTSQLPAVTTLVVDPPAGVRQHATRNLRDAAGNGPTTEFTLDYRPEGVHLVALKVTTGFNGITDVRELRPASPVLLLATGARPGAHLDIDLTGTTTATLAVDVLREERLTIGGQAVDTLVMRATVTLAPGDVTGRQELTVNIDRATRLWVKERSVLDATALGGLVTAHSEYTATLQRLTS